MAVPVSIILAAAQILFAWNIVQTLRGRVRERDTLGSPRALAVGTAALVAAAIGGWAAFGSTGGGTAATTTSPTPAAPAALPGKKVFTTVGCSGCHTLKDAGATGTVGPNLDDKQPSAAIVVRFVTNGKKAMPPYKGTLSARQIRDVANYVSSVAGK